MMVLLFMFRRNLARPAELSSCTNKKRGGRRHFRSRSRMRPGCKKMFRDLHEKQKQRISISVAACNSRIFYRSSKKSWSLDKKKCRKNNWSWLIFKKAIFKSILSWFTYLLCSLHFFNVKTYIGVNQLLSRSNKLREITLDGYVFNQSQTECILIVHWFLAKSQKYTARILLSTKASKKHQSSECL